MRRYRIRLGYPRGRIKSETVEAADARTGEFGELRLVDDKGDTVAIYKPGFWTICKVIGS